MSDIIKSAPSGLSQCVYVIDSIVCKKIHNPIISALVVGGTLVSVTAKLSATWSPYGILEESGALPDFLQNAMNLLFILRFPSKLRKALCLKSNKLTEALLFMLLNVVAVASLCSPYPFTSLLNLAFRVLLCVLIACPYVILMLNLVEYAWSSTHEKTEEDKLLSSPKKESLLSLIIDANNSFMAISMAQSFTAINLDLPFFETSILPHVYRYAAYSLKFYLIYCFVLYEIVVVIYDIDDIKSYDELYTLVLLGAKKSTWCDRLNGLTLFFLLGTTAYAMLFDATLIYLSYGRL